MRNRIAHVAEITGIGVSCDMKRRPSGGV